MIEEPEEKAVEQEQLCGADQQLPTKQELQDQHPSLDDRQIEFLERYARTGNLKDSAMKAFAGSAKQEQSKDPAKYGDRFLRSMTYDRQIMEYFANRFGMTDQYLLLQLKDGLDSLSWNSKLGTLKLQIIETIFKLKGRYQEVNNNLTLKGANITLNQQTISSTTNIQQHLNDFIHQVRSEMNDDQIKELLSGTQKTIDIKPVVDKEKLFSDKDNIG